MGLKIFAVERGDTLRNPVFTDPSTGSLATFDCVIANPPFSLEQWGENLENDPWGRNFAGLPTDSSGRLCLGAAHGEVDGCWKWTDGCGAATGALFRGGWKDRIRKYLLEHDLIETVIGLAPNLFYWHGLAACILVLRKAQSCGNAPGRCRLVDASSLFRKGRAQNFLETETCHRNPGWVQSFADVHDRTKVVTLKQIQAEDWTLNISRYVLPPIGEDISLTGVAIADFKAALERARRLKSTCAKSWKMVVGWRKSNMPYQVQQILEGKKRTHLHRKG